MLLNEIKLKLVDHFEVSQVERDDEKLWQVTAWVEPPTAYNLAVLYNDIKNCPEEIKKYLKKVFAIEKTADDADESDESEEKSIEHDDDGIVFMYHTNDFDADDALRNAKMIVDNFAKHGKKYVSGK